MHISIYLTQPSVSSFSTDPIGQALCDRTMTVIERLNVDHATKMRYFLSKADTVPSERDRQKVPSLYIYMSIHLSSFYVYNVDRYIDGYKN